MCDDNSFLRASTKTHISYTALILYRSCIMWARCAATWHSKSSSLLSGNVKLVFCFVAIYFFSFRFLNNNLDFFLPFNHLLTLNSLVNHLISHQKRQPFSFKEFSLKMNINKLPIIAQHINFCFFHSLDIKGHRNCSKNV